MGGRRVLDGARADGARERRTTARRMRKRRRETTGNPPAPRSPSYSFPPFRKIHGIKFVICQGKERNGSGSVFASSVISEIGDGIFFGGGFGLVDL